MKDYQLEQLKRRAATTEAIAAAHVDSGKHGYGWIRVDTSGNLERVDPRKIKISYKVKS